MISLAECIKAHKSNASTRTLADAAIEAEELIDAIAEVDPKTAGELDFAMVMALVLKEGRHWDIRFEKHIFLNKTMPPNRRKIPRGVQARYDYYKAYNPYFSSIGWKPCLLFPTASGNARIVTKYKGTCGGYDSVDFTGGGLRLFEKAFALDPVAALKSTSWGAWQVMGGNFWDKLKHEPPSGQGEWAPEEFVAAFCNDPIFVSKLVTAEYIKSLGVRNKALFVESASTDSPTDDDFLTVAWIHNRGGKGAKSKADGYAKGVKKLYISADKFLREREEEFWEAMPTPEKLDLPEYGAQEVANPNQPPPYTVAAHRRGPTSLYLEWFVIPLEDRGKGEGAKRYLEWEAGLPKWVKEIYLHAADSGSGPTDMFWDSVGYDWVYDISSDESDDYSYEDQHFMVKKIEEIQSEASSDMGAALVLAGFVTGVGLFVLSRKG